MAFLNVEIKASCSNIERIEEILLDQNARFVGIDHQVDTYFNVNNGRMKLREGNIENALIFYQRDNASGPKSSNVILYKSDPDSSLKSLLEKSCGILCVVDKTRKIFFIENIKFHIDEVTELGSFVEIEAIDEFNNIGIEKLQQQTENYMKLFNIQKSELVAVSYSDLLLKTKSEL